MRTLALLPLLLGLGASAEPAAGQPPPAAPATTGFPDAGQVPVEVEVEKSDGGFVLGHGWPTPAPSRPDAGQPTQPEFLPPELLADSPATYPPEYKKEALSGEVKLELLIDAQGAVSSATVVGEDRPGFNAAALEAASGLKFKPATLNGAPVPVRLTFTYHFQAPTPAEQGPETAVKAAKVRGRIQSKGNRRAIPGAAIYLKVLDKTIEADAAGQFEVELPPGRRVIQASAPGFRTGTFQERLNPGESVSVIYSLEPLIVNPYETFVRGERDRTEVSRITLQEQELREVPGTMGDPFRVVMLLPGVSTIISGVAYPVVRGSQPAATGYFLDGVRVPILFHLLLGPAVVHPDFIEAIDFYPGAPPPQFGRLLGGVIEGKISRARDDRVHTTGYVDLINAGAFLEVPISQTGTNLTLAGRLSYTPWLLAILASTATGAQHTRVVLDFYDYQGRIEQRIGPGRLRLLVFGSSDVVGAQATDTSGVTALQSIIFHRVDLQYRQPLGAGEIAAGVTLGVDRLRIETGGEVATVGFNLDDRSVRGRAVWSTPLLKDLKLEVGGDVDHRNALSTVTIPDEISHLPKVVETPVAVGTFMSAWAQAVITGVPRLTLIPGARVDNYHLVPGINHVALEPRLTVRYEPTDALTLKGGAGLYHQPPTELISLPADDVASLRFGLQTGLQTSVSAEWQVRDGLQVSTSVYYNPLLRTLELSPFDRLRLGDDSPETGKDPSDDLIREQISHGYAYGLEILIRHPLGGNWFGWLSYSLQRSVRRKTIARHNEFGEPVSTDQVDLPFVYDQTHVLNAVLSYKFPGGWTVGGVFHFHTGLPETGGLGGLTSTTEIPGVDMMGNPTWIEADLDKADRLPPFFRVDARVAKAWAFDDFTLEIYLDVLNALFSKEVLGFDYLKEPVNPANPAEGVKLVKEPISIPLFLPILGIKAVY